ncbi:hypothetical protein EI42_05651 [Thermosporothrix hazakensis]|jgi:DNA-directed RNA polymerase sigma subunit (sigma70/sigma32)|uniref:Uncharacterized protein n=1 Tax=Thermosporothrix hazakensis TaxID=644383 RepID=A0A326TWC6_THEHA|nr:hypothetical protein EI42_05651 [Thermosporothrix hazakensis]GCE50720.1 hypothetical protein KTH_55890 [Thermosporothrix hazakensis]
MEFKITERPEYRAQAPKQISLNAPIGNSEDLVYEDLISDISSIEDEWMEAEEAEARQAVGRAIDDALNPIQWDLLPGRVTEVGGCYIELV